MARSSIRSERQTDNLEVAGSIPAAPTKPPTCTDFGTTDPRYTQTRIKSEYTVSRINSNPKLPTDATSRKGVPIATGFIDYFPDAIAAVAELSRIGNDQHNPGKPLFWNRSKSQDEADALMRHFLERGTLDTDGVRHSTKVAWRALALLQKELES